MGAKLAVSTEEHDKLCKERNALERQRADLGVQTQFNLSGHEEDDEQGLAEEDHRVGKKRDSSHGHRRSSWEESKGGDDRRVRQRAGTDKHDSERSHNPHKRHRP